MNPSNSHRCRAVRNAGFRNWIWLALVSASLAWVPGKPLRGQPPAGALQENLPADLWTRAGVDWPKFLGPGQDSKSPETGIRKDWTAGKLKALWTLPTGEGYCMGTVARGRFFHFGLEGGRAVLKCLNAETGKLIWEFGYDSDYADLYGYDRGPRASPVVDADRVYIFGVAGKLHCLDVASGKLKWHVDTTEQFGVIQNFFGVGSTPLVVDDQLLVMVGGSPASAREVPPGALNRVQPNGTGIVAFDKFTGQVNYRSFDDLASYSSLKLAKVNGQTLVLAWMRSGLTGFEPQSGKAAFVFPWRSRKLESVNAATPVVIGNQIFLSECYELGSVLINLESGQPEVAWSDQGKRNKALEAHWNTPVVIDSFLYASSGRHAGDAELRCVDWRTGELKWSHSGLSRASVTSIDGCLAVMGELGDLVLIEATPEDYREITRYEPEAGSEVRLKAPCWSAPVISHGLMWVRGKDQLVCFELIPDPAK